MLKSGRVEERRGVAPAIRFPPRLSNAACRFPALPSPTGFVARPTAVVQRQNSEPSEDEVAGELPGSATGYLMPPSEEMPDASADVMINRFVCPVPCPIAEVGGPA